MYRQYIPRGSQFLINFAYSGATYSGVQRQTSRKDGDVQHTQHENFDHTVQMAVEIGIMDLKPKPVFMFTQVASRTDAGVSALDNYMMVRLEHPDFPASDYDASHMEDSINSYLYDNEHPIAVKGIQPVEQNFRFGDKQTVVLWREYAYRFVICDDVDDDSVKAADVKVPTFMPPFEMTRISRIKAGQRMDLKLFQDALKAMEGEHSFRSFECFTKALYSGHEYERDPMKNIQKITFSTVSMQTGSVFDHYYNRDGDIFEVRIRSKSFLYKQVRRMIGAAIMVACGRMDMQRLNFMLDYGHRWNWQDHYVTAPPEGLVLVQTMWTGIAQNQ